MQQEIFMLLTTVVLGALAIFFTIIGVATPGWPNNKIRLFSCGTRCPYNYTTAGVLLIIAIAALVVAILLTIMFLRQVIRSSADRIKGIVLACFVLAAIFIISAYSQAIIGNFYSYHLSVTAGILAFLSAIFFSYWIGRTSVTI